MVVRPNQSTDMFSQVLPRMPEQLNAAATAIEPLGAAVHVVVSIAMDGCLPSQMTIDDGLFAATAAATVRGFLAGPPCGL